MNWERATDVGVRLKNLREALGLLQEQFSETVGVTGQSISDYETGRSKPSKSRLERLARQVGIPVAAFAEGGPMPATLLQSPLVARTPEVRENGVSRYVVSGHAVSVDVRPPMGEQARQILEHRIAAAALEGHPVQPTELDYWLKLVRWAATSDQTAGGASDIEKVEAVENAERLGQAQKRTPKGA